MINWDTLISAFDKTGTLMKWLIAVEKALKSAALASFKVEKISDTTAKFIAVFADGSKVESNDVELPAGKDGKDGATGARGEPGATGAQGEQGVSVTELTLEPGGLVDGNATYNLYYELSDRVRKQAGSFTVNKGEQGERGERGLTGPQGVRGEQGERGESVTLLELEPGSVSDEATTYNLYYSIGAQPRELAGDILIPNGGGAATILYKHTVEVRTTDASGCKFFVQFISKDGTRITDADIFMQYVNAEHTPTGVYAIPIWGDFENLSTRGYSYAYVLFSGDNAESVAIRYFDLSPAGGNTKSINGVSGAQFSDVIQIIQ